MVHPRDFKSEYVDPAVMLWLENQGTAHLAIHAITQIDVLAEVVALHSLLEGRRTLPRVELQRFRTQLESREPILAVIHEAHDCHKHGALDRKSAKTATQGQRPRTAVGYGIFADVSFVGDSPTEYTHLVFPKDDGTEMEVFDLLHEAMRSWDREFDRFGFLEAGAKIEGTTTPTKIIR